MKKIEEVTKELVYLDTETTGTGEHDKVIQVAYKIGDKESGDELFKPELPIKIEAMAVCHITNKMVEDKKPFQGSDMHERLFGLLRGKETVMIAHNAKFDVGMLEKEGIKSKNVICTYKIAQHLDEKGIIPSYSMQYLRYLLDLDIEAVAHDAMGDVLVLEGLFERLFEKMFEKLDKEIPFLTGDDVIESMIKVSSRPILIKKFTFGKHKGRFIKDVAQTDLDYLRWLHREKSNEEIPDENWIYTLNKYLV